MKTYVIFTKNMLFVLKSTWNFSKYRSGPPCTLGYLFSFGTCGDRDPHPCNLRDWVENNWWASADETFNLIANNREQFFIAIKSKGRRVSRADNFLNENSLIFQSKFDYESSLRPLASGTHLDRNGDSEVSIEEFSKLLIDDLVVAEQYDEFVAKYWHIFDSDNSGTLNFDEYVYSLTVLADAFGRLFIKVRKLISF